MENVTEEYIIEHADTFDWNSFRCDPNKFSEDFMHTFRNEIRSFAHRNEEGQFHRVDGPAVYSNSGAKHWFLNGRLHRTNGPAVISAKGNKQWYVNGIEHTEVEFATLQSNNKTTNATDQLEEYITNNADTFEWDKFRCVVNNHTDSFIDQFNDDIQIRIWTDDNGDWHRTDGPAVIEGDSQHWCIHGKYHKEDGPAIIYEDGSKEWFLNGERHREDGPAVIYEDGDKEWYLNGVELSEKAHKQLIQWKGTQKTT